MSAPYPGIDSLQIINDPNFVPLGVEAGVTLCTEDGTFIIVSSSLRVRSNRGRVADWLRSPPNYGSKHIG